MKIRYKFVIYGVIGIALWFLSGYLLLAALSVERRLDHADAIVVLGGSADYKKRTDAAANLWKAGVAPRIIVTDDGQLGGWNNVAQRNTSFAERAVSNLVGCGVDGEAIEVSSVVGQSTHDEAELIADLSVDRNFHSIILVTSSFHTRRALWTFERVARNRSLRIVYGMEYPDSDRSSFYKLFWWLDLNDRRNIPLEIMKHMYYWIAF
jgi:uncharacterized SAM-binding protein YcdF (DUF218 family)